jgi:hypothetical protein
MLIRPAIGDTDPIRYRRPTPDGQFSGNIIDEAMRSFERDASGELTGVLVETAIDRVEKAVPPWSEDDEVRQFKIAEGVLNGFGITSVVEGAIVGDLGIDQVLDAFAGLRFGHHFDPRCLPSSSLAPGDSMIPTVGSPTAGRRDRLSHSLAKANS